MKRKSFLLVDDETIILDSLKRDLELENFRVSLATSGEQAISLINQEAFDLIITDLVMPEKSGLELIMEIREKNPELKIYS